MVIQITSFFNKIYGFINLPKQWKYAVKVTVWNCFWSLCPIFLCIILFIIYSKTFKLSYFSDNGQFAIYSIMIIASALFLVLKDYKTSNFPGRHVMAFLCIVVLLIAILMFIAVTVYNEFPIPAILNRPFLIYLSFFIYISSLIIVFLASAFDYIRAYTDITIVQRQSLLKLEKDFDGLGE